MAPAAHIKLPPAEENKSSEKILPAAHAQAQRSVLTLTAPCPLLCLYLNQERFAIYPVHLQALTELDLKALTVPSKWIPRTIPTKGMP